MIRFKSGRRAGALAVVVAMVATTVTLLPARSAEAARTGNGRLDPTYSGGYLRLDPIPVTSDWVSDVVTAPNRIYAVGHTVGGTERSYVIGTDETGARTMTWIATTTTYDALFTAQYGSARAKAIAYDPRTSDPSDDRIYVAGTVAVTAGTHSGDFIVALKTNGTLDTGFSGDGLAGDTDPAGGVITITGMDVNTATGDVTVAGHRAGSAVVVRRNADGSLDTGFSGDGIATTALGAGATVEGMALSGELVYVAGSATSTPHFANTPIVGRYTATGLADTAFAAAALGAPNGFKFIDFSIGGVGAFSEIGTFDSVAVGAPGIAFTGWYRHTNQVSPGNNDYFIATAVLNTSGGFVNTFVGTGTYPDPNLPGRLVQKWTGDTMTYPGDSVWDASNRLLITGWTGDNPAGDDDMGVARVLSTGRLDTTWGEDGDGSSTGVAIIHVAGNDSAMAVTVDSAGRAIVGGTGDNNRDGIVARLTTAPEPIQSTTRVVFDVPGGGVYSMGIDGSRVTLIDAGGAEPSVSPNGIDVVYQAFDTGEIKSARVDGGGITTLDGTCDGEDPVFSPDGSRIAWARKCAAKPELWVMNADGSNKFMISNGHEGGDTEPAWSPDGTKVAYTRDFFGGGNPRPFHIGWDPAVPGGDPIDHAISSIGNDNTQASWGAAGVVYSKTDNSGELWLLADPIGGIEGVKILSGASGDTAWHPDGQQLLIAGYARNFATGDLGPGIWIDANPLGENAAAPSFLTQIYAGEVNTVSVARVIGASVDAPTVAANPTSIATKDIPVQSNAPATKAAGLVQLGKINIPLVDIPAMNTGLVQLGKINIPLDQVSPMRMGLGLHNAANPYDLGSSAKVRKGLEKITLHQINLKSVPDWHTRLAGTPLEKLQLQSVTLADVLPLVCASETDCPAGRIKPSKLPMLGEIDLKPGAFGSLSTLALLLGDTRFTSMTFDLCTQLVTLGHADCGAALGVQNPPASDTSAAASAQRTLAAQKGRSASLLALELAGVNPDKIAGLSQLKWKDVAFSAANTSGYAPLPNVAVRSVDLNASSIGSILIKDLPNKSAVIDNCGAGTDCTSATAILASVDKTHIKPTATLLTLGATLNELLLQEVALGVITGSPSDQAFDIPQDKMGVLGYQDPATDPLTYTVGLGTLAPISNPTVSMKLPVGFRFDVGSAQWAGGGASGPLAPTVTSNADSTESLSFAFTSGSQPPAMAITFTARPGLTMGLVTRTLTDLALSATDVASGQPVTAGNAGPPITVTPNLENGDVVTDTTPIALDTMYFGFLDHANDIDYFELPPISPGSRISAFMSNCGCDADLVLYHPSSAKPSVPLRPVASGAPVTQGLTDQAIAAAEQGEPLVPESERDIPVANRPVAAASTNRGPAAEELSALAWDAPSGRYLLQVSGYNGVSSPQAYNVHVTEVKAPTLPAGAQRFFPTAGEAGAPTSPLTPIGTDRSTVILTAPTRMRATYGAVAANAMLQRVNDLALSPVINGVVIPVDSSATVRTLFSLLDAQPSDPERSNDVVRAINTYVDSVLGARRNKVKSIIVVGSDEIIPMARIPDLTITSNERLFAQDLMALAEGQAKNNALLGAAAAGTTLTDDGLGAFGPKPFLGTYLYVPDVAMGRLVETPTEITSVVDQFLTPTQQGDAHGILHPTSSLTTGHEFMVNMAEAVRDSLAAQLTPEETTALVSNSWTIQDLQAAFSGNGAGEVPDVVSINAHYDPTALLSAAGSVAKDPAQILDAEALFTDSLDMSKRILFEIGCHSGLNVADVLATGVSASVDTKDWPQIAAGRGVAAMVANTGYGLALDSTPAFSAKLFLGYANNMTHMTLGQALTQAKQDYLADGVPNVYDYKVMAQATYFGIPDFRVDKMAPLPVPAPNPAPTDYRGGALKVLPVTMANPASGFQPVTTASGTYLTLPDGDLAVAPNRPIQPKVVRDVTQPSLTAMGSLITGLTSDDSLGGFNPTLARPVLDLAEHEPEAQFESVIYPNNLAATTTYQAADGTTRQNLVVIPAQFQSGPGGTTSGLQRRFTNVSSQVFYRPAGTTPVEAPLFRNVTAVKSGSAISFSATVTDAVPIDRVLVLWHPVGAVGAWTATDLAAGPNSTWTAPATSSSSKIEFFVQALSTSGAVARTSNKGDLFESVVATLPPGAITYELSNGPSNGYYPNGTKVTFHGAPTFTVTVGTGAPQAVPDGGSITLTGTATHAVHYVAGAASGDINVPVDATVPTISGARSPAGNVDGWNNTNVAVTFSCADAHSGIASCGPNQTVSAEGTAPGISGQATDNVGNTMTSAAVTGIKIDKTKPTITGTQSPAVPASGWNNGDVVVSFTCSDALSGMKSACAPAQTATATGTVTSAAVTDKAGNAATATVNVKIDKTKPTITASVAPAPTVDGWNGTDVVVSFACADEPGGSGLAAGACPAPVTVSSSTTVVRSVVDIAGNVQSASADVKIDRVSPTLTSAIAPAPNAAGWSTGTVTVTFTCSDALSGVKTCTAPVTQTTHGSVTGTAVDKAGNSATSARAVQMDLVNPTITAAVTPAAPNGSNGWYNTAVTVTFTCADGAGAGSGISGTATCEAPKTVTTASTTGTNVTGTTTDRSGRTGTVTRLVAKVDTTKPVGVVHSTDGVELIVPGKLITGTATDAALGSGVQTVIVTLKKAVSNAVSTVTATVTCNAARTSCTWSAPKPGNGTYEATPQTTDAAGNVHTGATVTLISLKA